MSKISIKKDFKDGEKLFAEQLNNNFAVIETGVNANEEDLEAVIQDAETRLQKELENITVDRGWDWGGSSTDRVTFYKGTTDAVNAQAIKNGQMLYNTETGETALDDNGERIITGSGNVVSIGEEEPTNNATKIWIDPEEIGEPLPHQLVVSPEEPATGEEVWFKNDEQKAVMVKNKDGAYEEFVKPQVKVGVEEPTTGEEVWIKKSNNLFNVSTPVTKYRIDTNGYFIISSDKDFINQRINVAGDITVSWERVDTTPTIRIAEYSRSGSFLNMQVIRPYSDISPQTLTLSDKTSFIIVSVEHNNTDKVYNLQIEKGTIATPYTSYFKDELYTRLDDGTYAPMTLKTNSESVFMNGNLKNLTLGDMLKNSEGEVFLKTQGWYRIAKIFKSAGDYGYKPGGLLVFLGSDHSYYPGQATLLSICKGFDTSIVKLSSSAYTNKAISAVRVCNITTDESYLDIYWNVGDGANSGNHLMYSIFSFMGGVEILKPQLVTDSGNVKASLEL